MFIVITISNKSPKSTMLLAYFTDPYRLEKVEVIIKV